MNEHGAVVWAKRTRPLNPSRTNLGCPGKSLHIHHIARSHHNVTERRRRLCRDHELEAVRLLPVQNFDPNCLPLKLTVGRKAARHGVPAVDKHNRFKPLQDDLAGVRRHSGRNLQGAGKNDDAQKGPRYRRYDVMHEAPNVPLTNPDQVRSTPSRLCFAAPAPYKRPMSTTGHHPFVKMNGLGNEIVVLDLRTSSLKLAPDLVRAIASAPRSHFDQMMVLHPPQTPGTDAFVVIYNTDGSESSACGNGTRCIGLYEQSRTGRDKLRFETKAGPPQCRREGCLRRHRRHG